MIQDMYQSPQFRNKIHLLEPMHFSSQESHYLCFLDTTVRFLDIVVRFLDIAVHFLDIIVLLQVIHPLLHLLSQDAFQHKTHQILSMSQLIQPLFKTLTSSSYEILCFQVSLAKQDLQANLSFVELKLPDATTTSPHKQHLLFCLQQEHHHIFYERHLDVTSHNVHVNEVPAPNPHKDETSHQ